MKFILIAMTFLCYLNSGCSQDFGPGYSFELFRNTPNWDLAKAVKNENEKEIRKLIKERRLNIDLQESKFGNTLLLLAIGNDKLIATKVLLEEGANVNVTDSEMNKPIHEATHFLTLKSHSFEILKLLIQYGANVNDTLIKIDGKDTIKFYVPLMGAKESFKCAKLLLDNGANPYVKVGGTYFIWRFIDGGKRDESIFFTKYLIVDKKMLIPNPIDFSMPYNVPLDIFYFLNKENMNYDLKKEKAKNEIISYLKKINFPTDHFYK